MQQPGEGAPSRSSHSAAKLNEEETGIADMRAKFAEAVNELYVSESGQKREAID